MRRKWQLEQDRLACQWSTDELQADGARYQAPWIDDPSLGADSDNAAPPVPEGTVTSPFGHSEWRPGRPETRI